MGGAILTAPGVSASSAREGAAGCAPAIGAAANINVKNAQENRVPSIGHLVLSRRQRDESYWHALRGTANELTSRTGYLLACRVASKLANSALSILPSLFVSASPNFVSNRGSMMASFLSMKPSPFLSSFANSARV